MVDGRLLFAIGWLLAVGWLFWGVLVGWLLRRMVLRDVGLLVGCSCRALDLDALRLAGLDALRLAGLDALRLVGRGLAGLDALRLAAWGWRPRPGGQG